MTVELFVPYEKKEEAKKLNARYNVDSKKWYCDNDNNECINAFGYKFFSVRYDSDVIELLKKHHCRYSPELRQWFTYKSNNDINKYI